MTSFFIVMQSSCGCRWRPPRWAERRWVRRRSFVPRSRLCSSSRCIDQHSVDRSTRTRLVPTVCAERSRSRLSPVAGCGRSGCRSTSLASGGTAAATASGAHSASPRLAARCAASTLPCRMSSPAAALLAAAHPSHCPAFDVLLYRPARPTTVTTVAGTEVAGVSSALCDSIMAEFVLLSLRSLLPLVLPAAARRCGAAWRRPRHTWRRGAAAAIIRRLGRAARTSPATFP